MTYVLCLPYPISANRYWAHRVYRDKATGQHRAMVYVTADAVAYKDEVKARARLAGILEPIAGRVELAWRLYPHRPQDYEKRMRQFGEAWDDTVQCLDLSNTVKVMEDALQGTVIANDKFVRRLTGERMEPDQHGARLMVWVRPLVVASPQAALELAD